MRRLIKGILAALAAEIVESSDGAEALVLYTRHHPDFVLMDIQMEVVDGIAATRQIKSVDPGARVIMVTQYDQPDLREAAAKAGACGFVVKDNLLELLPLLKAQASGGGSPNISGTEDRQ